MRHKLDEEVEDILTHYGVKGMRWGVQRDPIEIQGGEGGGGGGEGEDPLEKLEDAGDEVLGNESIIEEFGDVMDVFFGGKGNLKKEVAQFKDAVKDKVEDIGPSIKKRGKRMLERIGKNVRLETTTSSYSVSSSGQNRSTSSESTTVVKDGLGNTISKTKRVNGKLVKGSKKDRKTPNYYTPAKDR